MKKQDALTRKLLADPKVKAAYEEMEPEYALAREMIAARHRAGRTDRTPVSDG